MVCVREWRFIGTCVCLRESLAQRSFTRLFGSGFQSLLVSQSEAWEALQRMDTSLLRAACNVKMMKKPARSWNAGHFVNEFELAQRTGKT